MDDFGFVEPTDDLGRVATISDLFNPWRCLTPLCSFCSPARGDGYELS